MAERSYWVGGGQTINSLGGVKYRSMWIKDERPRWNHYEAPAEPQPPHHFPTTRLYCTLRGMPC